MSFTNVVRFFLIAVLLTLAYFGNMIALSVAVFCIVAVVYDYLNIYKNQKTKNEK